MLKLSQLCPPPTTTKPQNPAKVPACEDIDGGKLVKFANKKTPLGEIHHDSCTLIRNQIDDIPPKTDGTDRKRAGISP